MKRRVQIMAAILSASMIVALPAETALAGNHENRTVIEQRTNSSGWNFLDGSWYYFNNDGTAETGWLYTGGKWYYLNQEGVMQTGIQNVGGAKYYFESNGKMATGWRFVNGVWYYFNGSGAARTGWLFSGNNWYYMNSDGVMQTGLQNINGVKYYFESNGKMATGWRFLDGSWYYFKGSGAAQTGWQKVGNVWYYMNESHVMQTGWQKISGEWYYFNGSGAMQTGWQRISGTWYFLDSSGKWISDISAKLNEITKYTYVPYVSGGTSTSGWDCSGFTQWAMKQMGVSIPRTAAEQSKVGKSISVSDKSQWKPGDLLYFKMNGRIGHAALYLGNGQMMHALNPRYGTYITSVDAYCKWDKQNVLTYVKRVL